MAKIRIDSSNMSDNIEQLKLKIESLQNELALKDESSLSNSIESMDLLVLRWDGENVIRYVNQPFCNYLNIEKKDLITNNVSILNSFFDSVFMQQLEDLEIDAVKIFEFVDQERNKSFQANVKLNANRFVDLILLDITEQTQLQNYVNRYLPISIKDLNEDDLKTFRYPEKRVMSVSFSDLREFTKISESLTPENVRMTANACFEEMINAINKNKATVDKIMGDEVMALYGAPRTYEQHALLAIKTACDQLYNLNALRKSFKKFNKHIPNCGIGINSGEMILGNIGSSFFQDYTVLGKNVNIASRLCSIAKPNQILTTELTLKSLLDNLPQGWQKNSSIEQNENEDDLLSEDLKNKVIRIGPEVVDYPEKAYFVFRYLYKKAIKGIEEPIVIISAESGSVLAQSTVIETAKTTDKGEIILGNYRLEEIIGTGTMGEVWQAKDSLGGTVAVKLLKNTETQSSVNMERLKKEADIMYTLRHPGICNIYNVGVSEDIPYIAMELINGLPLSELLNYTENDNLNIKKETMSVETIPDLIEAAILNKKPKLLHRTRRLSLRNFFLLIGELGEIIALAHNNGIVHRDIKPANIIIRKTGEPVFMDFGLSVSVKEGKNLSKMPIEGSLDYLAPELLEKDTSPSFKSDIYSFGALMYLLLTGRKHFARSTNLLHDLQNLKDLKIKSLSEYNPMVPENLNTLVSSCLSQKPQNRYASMENLMSDLDDCRRGIFKRSKTKKENPFKKVKSWFKS